MARLKNSKTKIEPTFPGISVLPESARLCISGQGISGVFGRDRNGPISGNSGNSGNLKIASNPHAACDARFQGIEMNKINNFSESEKSARIGKIAIRAFSVSSKTAGKQLAGYESVHGEYSLRQAETLRWATYRDPARLDNADMVEGMVWLLKKAAERATTLRDTSKAAMPCNKQTVRFWAGFNALVGDIRVPMVLRVGSNTRLWMPK
jgi:hypothetical protein